MYYGKTGVATTGNGDNTFLFFDHFDGSNVDTAKWSFITGALNNGRYSVGSSIVNFTSEPASIGHSFATITNVAVRARAYGNNPTWYGGTVLGVSGPSTLAFNTGVFNNPSNPFFINGYGNNQGAYCPTSWDIIEAKMDGSHVSGWTSGVMRGSQYARTEGVNLIFIGSGDAPVYDSGDAHVDWVLMRNYIASEPTASFGTETSN
jgi:hypothetical protein